MVYENIRALGRTDVVLSRSKVRLLRLRDRKEVTEWQIKADMMRWPCHDMQAVVEAQVDRTRAVAAQSRVCSSRS
jgi:hypothetical protein